MVLATATMGSNAGIVENKAFSSHAARLSLSEMEILGLLADKPLLSGRQIAEIRTSSMAWTWRLLSHLDRVGMVIYSVPPGEINTPANRFYHVSGDGIRLLAWREGVPPGRYARERWLSASRLTMLFNSLDHTTACRQFFIDLGAQERKRGDEALEVWLDEAAASRRYSWHGQVRLLRPDGYGLYRNGDRMLSFFLEWDSGNSGIKRHRRKLRTYHEYRATLGNLTFHAIVVVTVQHRVRQLRRAALDVAHRQPDRLLPLFIATRADVEAAGAFGCRWWDVRSEKMVDLESVPELWIDLS